MSKFANSLEAYFNIVAGLPVSYEDRRFVTGGQVYGEGNRIGNNLGSVDIALEYEGTGGHWLVYRQSVYEDGSLYYLSNISDGLSGISWQNKKGRQGIRKIVVEYLQTSNQGGPYSARIGLNYLRGQDNYFNNGVYEDGWVYRRQTMGTPFVMPLRYSTGLPLNEEPLQSLNPYYIFNNRVQAFTVSVQSQIQRVSLTTRVSNSRNFGNYRVDYPLSVKQLSLQQQVVFPIRQYTVLTTFAYDNAGLLEKNLGVSLLVKRTF
ncbi:hypothetical protein HNQ92_001369 [Rhabdobacter roseus]|uniref:Uncharacterized protein n=1 Tax=Rhabdobacter roseus TaxID=1655419 RepID=A0A840TPT3_9BACT|nr:hypothetical protein [Rhabdobacter roseus]